MNRKWRTNPGALQTVLPYHEFRASIPLPAAAALPGSYGGTPDAGSPAEAPLADPTDLYSVYTVLHIESKQAELRWSPHGRFHYFLAQWQQAATGAAPVAAPEGDEDPPPQIIPEGSEAALRQAAEHQQKQQQGGGKGRKGGSKAASAAGGSGAEQQQQQQQEQSQQEQRQQGQQEQQQQQEQQSEQPEQPQPPVAATSDPAAAAADAAAGAAAGAAAPPATRTRTQILVPVSSACRALTPELLQRFFSVRGVQAQQLLLAMVDANGVVTRSCLYNYIQAPLEGPGTANLELLDD